MGEEYGSENESAEFVWVLDPIDGTKAFAAACPLFGTLIALLHQGRPVLGRSTSRSCASCWSGMLGNGSARPGSPRRRVRGPAVQPQSSRRRFDQRSWNPGKYRNGAAAFDARARRARLVRTWGD